jgi:hypothetical protein
MLWHLESILAVSVRTLNWKMESDIRPLEVVRWKAYKMLPLNAIVKGVTSNKMRPGNRPMDRKCSLEWFT